MKRKYTTMATLVQSIEPFQGSKYYFDSKPNAALHTNSNDKYDGMWPC